FEQRRIDVLISKNSGSSSTEPKLQVARERAIPVLILKRPPLPVVDRELESVAAVLAALSQDGHPGG
uniref:precorrin-6A/cobalt-precorrin-6A reductase n=1 Tax=Pseudomonas viridiflava TaxID=33069 RepID=UPI00197CF6EB